MATNKLPSKDELARDAIINQRNKNIFVIAGAGSGKTSMLVNRMVSLIENGVDGQEVTIDQICAITFTVNAAAEFLERLKAVLDRRSKGFVSADDNRYGGLGATNADKQRRDKKALEDIDLCFANTIDAFCNLMLSEYPLNAEIPSSSEVLEDEEAGIFYKKEYKKLSVKYKHDDSFKAFVRLFNEPATIFASSIEDAITSTFLKTVYNKPTQGIDDFVKDFKNKYETGIENDLVALLNSESILNTNNKDSVEGFKSFENRAKKLMGNFRRWELKDVLEVQYLLSDCKKMIFTSQVNGTTYINYDLSGKFHKFNESSDIVEITRIVKDMVHSYSLDFLLKCANDVRTELKNQGKLTFDEYLFTFKELIKKDLNTSGTPIIKHIRNRFKYFLLDESQDTSPFQYELFLFLNSTVPALEIDDVVMEKGSLFIVGDPKQSIYRFRNADINSYNRVRDLFTNANNKNDSLVLELTYNFRSSKLLCEYFNAQFGEGSLQDYTPIDNVDDRPDQNQGLYYFEDYVEVIKTIVNNPNYKVNRKNNNEDPKIQYKDIMIICKSKQDKLSVILEALDAEGIPCYSDDDNHLGNYQIVEALYAIYAFIANKDKPGYEYNLLASPLFGLDKREVLSTDKFLSLTPEHKALLDVIDGCANITDPVLLMDKIINDIDILKYVKSQKLEFAYYVLNKIKEAFVEQKILSLKDGADFLNDLMTGRQERIASLKYAPNAVRISNVHKVKGLEAPVVILYRTGIDNNPAMKVTSHKDYSTHESYLIRLSKRESSSGNSFSYNIDNSATFENEVGIEVAERIEEDKRLRYVAATRARDYLFIQVGGKSNFWGDLMNDDIFADFVPDITQITKFDTSRSVVPDDQIYPTNRPSPVFDAAESYSVVLPSRLKLNTDGESEEHAIKDETDNSAAEKGTLIHALLEIYVSSGMKYSKDNAVFETLNRFGLQVNQEYEQLLSTVFDTMTSGGYTQASGNKEDLFEILKNADEIYCEMPFAYQDGSNIYNGSIDLFYKYKGEYYIVDYKTNYDGNNLDEKYALQLEAYKQAVKNIAGITASARIYHIDTKD